MLYNYCFDHNNFYLYILAFILVSTSANTGSMLLLHLQHFLGQY